MADKTLQIINDINGVPTDLDSLPVLSNLAATYGVRVVSSGAQVPATLGAAFTKTDTGAYEITVTGLTAGVEYQYAITEVYDGATDVTEETFTIAAAAIHYGSQAGVIALLGPANESTYADIDNDANAVTKAAQEEAALTEGDTKVDAYLLGAGIVDTIASTDSDYRFIVYAANRYAAVALSRMRGLPQDAQGRVYDPYRKYVDEADAMLERFVYNRLHGGKALPGVFQFIPVLDPTESVDENSRCA